MIDATEPTSIAAESAWNQFHGRDSHGNAGAGNLPRQWQASDYAWTVSLNARHVGSPVTADDRVFFLDTSSGSSDAGETSLTLDLVAVNLADGTIAWRRPHPYQPVRQHTRNTPASSTPVVHDGRVYFAYGDANHASLHAYDLSGQTIWSRDLGPWSGVHGFGASPVVLDSKLILFNDQQGKQLEAWQTAGEANMMAFDLATGDTIWETPLTTTRPSYGVPAFDGTNLIAANTGDGFFAIDPKTGTKQWSLSVFNKRSCSSTIIVGDDEGGRLAIGSCGSGGGGNYLSAVRIPRDESQSPEEVFRVTTAAPYVPTPAVRGDWLFLVSDSGIATCIDWKRDGEKVWSKRLGGNFGASPIIVGDHLLAISLDGVAHVMSASDSPGKISKFGLGGPVGATPAFANGRLILRIDATLCCLSTEPSESATR